MQRMLSVKISGNTHNFSKVKFWLTYTRVNAKNLKQNPPTIFLNSKNRFSL